MTWNKGRVKFHRTAAIIPAALAIVSLPFYFGSSGIHAYFSGDDLMNLHGYWSKPPMELLKGNLLYYSASYRPLGGLFYVGLYSLFGLNPLPFRIVCMALFFLNLLLGFRLLNTLTSSLEMALLATLFFAHHAGYADFYQNTGVIFDLLCFTFYCAGLELYIAARKDGRPVSATRFLAIVLAFLCALNSKEMAVSFPVVILLYEIIIHKSLANIGKALLLALMVVPYLFLKLSADSLFSTISDYKITLTLAQYTANNLHYHNLLFYLKNSVLTPGLLLGLLLGLLALAGLLRSKLMLFAMAFLLVTPLPIIFISPRGSTFVYYIPLVGYSLYAASALLQLRGKCFQSMPDSAHRTMQAITFCLAFLLLFNLHAGNIIAEVEDARLRQTAFQLRALNLKAKGEGRLLFLKDSFEKEDWSLLYICRLLYNNPALEVDRIKRMTETPTAAEEQAYMYVLTHDGGKYQIALPAH